MRRVIASVLQSGANLFQLVDSTKQHDQPQRAIDGVVDRVGKNISALRTMSEAVAYEFGVDREQHIRSSEVFLQSSLTAAALAEPGLVEMRENWGSVWTSWRALSCERPPLPAEHLESSVSPHLLESDHYGEYARNTIAVFHHA